MKKTIKQFIEDFIKEKAAYFYGETNNIYKSSKIYNEMSLQHELGIYLRDKLESQGFRVDFERNAKKFKLSGEDTFKKHEIDIVIYNDTDNDTGKKYAIELKYQFEKNVAYNRALYSFVQDIEFMEQVKKGGFDETFCLVVTDNPYIYENPKSTRESKDTIYQYFRTYGYDEKDIKPIHGNIIKYLKNSDPTTYHIDGSYPIKWYQVNNEKEDKIMYYLLPIQPKSKL